MQNDADRRAGPATGISIPERLVMLLGGTMVGLSMAALNPVLPQIEAALAHGPADALLIKLLVTSIGVTMMIGAPLAGFLSDRIGMRRVLVVASLTLGVAGTAGLYLGSLWALMISRLFVGIAVGAIAATSMTLINARLEGIARARWMGLHVAIATIGLLLFYPLAGALGQLSWRAPFALYAAGFLFTGLALRFPHKVARSIATLDKIATSERFWQWFPAPFLLLAILVGSITYLPVVYVPFVARDAGVTSPFIISMIGLADSLITAAMAMMFANARRRLSWQTAFAVSFAFTATGMLIVATSSGFAGIVTGMVVYGFGLGWFVPNLMTAAAARVAPHQQGRTVGLIKAAHYVAAPVSTVLIEPLSRWGGPSVAMWAAAIISTVLCSFFSLLVFRGRISRTRSSA